MTARRLVECRGAALLAVLVALSVTSALVIGGAYVTRQLASASAIEQRGEDLVPFAEEAIVADLSGWDPAARDRQVPGTTVEAGTAIYGWVSVTSAVTRLDARSYWLVATVEGRYKPLLRRRLGLLVLADSIGAAPVPRSAWIDLP